MKDAGEFNIDFLSDLYVAEQRLKIQSSECKECWCFNCANQNKFSKCREKCFNRCKNKKYIWQECKHYEKL